MELKNRRSFNLTSNILSDPDTKAKDLGCDRDSAVAKTFIFITCRMKFAVPTNCLFSIYCIMGKNIFLK